MARTFLIKVSDPSAESLYASHSAYHTGDAGLDLFVTHEVQIPPGQTVLVDFGVSCQSRSASKCPWDWVRGKLYKFHSYLLLPRSSISKTPLIMRNSVGLIDRDYTGTIKAPLFNTSSESFTLSRGDRYVQLVNGDLSSVRCKLVSEHRETMRGQGGFGSTGQ